MKSRREHRVPLSARAREILAEARALAPRSESVFPSARGLELKSFDFSGLLKELGIAAVPHGFRSSFRDWAAERTDAPHAVMEAARVLLAPADRILYAGEKNVIKHPKLY